MSNTDFDQQQQAPPSPPPSAPSPLTQIVQKNQDRLQGGGVNWTSPSNLGVKSEPPPKDATPVVATAPVQPPKPEPPPPPQTGPAQTRPKPPQAYVPPPVRKMDHWGDDYWAIRAMENNPDIATTRHMPTEEEAYPVVAGSNRQLANWSAPAIAGPAGIISNLATAIGPFFDFYSHNAFSEHYRKVALGGTQQQLAELQIKERQMRMHEDEMKDKRERLIDMAEDLRLTHSQMLTEYRSVFDNLKNDHDEAKAKEDIAALNTKWHHQNLDSLLQNRGLGAVSNALDMEHNKFLHSWAGTTSLKSADKTRKEEEKEREKEEKQAEIEAPYRGDGAATPTGAGAAEPGGVMGYTPPAQATGTAPVTPEPAADPGESGDIGEPDLTKSPALSKADAAGFHNRAAINEVAEKMLLGDFKQAEFKGNDRVVAAARERETEMRQQIESIKAKPLKTKEDLYNALGGVSSRLRDQVEGLVSGEITPPQRTTASKPPWDLIYAMALKADPNLKTTLQTRSKTLNNASSGAMGAEFKQLGTAYDHGGALVHKLENLPGVMWQILAESEGLPVVGTLGLKKALQRAGQWFPETEAAIAALKGDIRTFSSESGTVLAGGGARGTAGERAELLEDINWRDPVSAIALVKDRMERMRDREAHLGMEFTAGTGMNLNEFMTRFKKDNPESAAGLTAIERDQGHDRSKAEDYRSVFTE